MNFKNTQTLEFPLPIVWATLRDHLPEIVSKQDDIEYINVEKRVKKAPHFLHVVSTWKSDPSLPMFLKNFIKPEMLVWTDDAMWDNEEHICRFTIEPHYKIENIQCVGTIAFKSLAGGKNTKITYSGTFTISKTDKSSIFMTGFILRGIEALAGTLISNNFSKTADALSATIAAQK